MSSDNLRFQFFFLEDMNLQDFQKSEYDYYNYYYYYEQIQKSNNFIFKFRFSENPRFQIFIENMNLHKFQKSDSQICSLLCENVRAFIFVIMRNCLRAHSKRFVSGNPRFPFFVENMILLNFQKSESQIFSLLCANVRAFIFVCMCKCVRAHSKHNYYYYY